MGAQYVPTYDVFRADSTFFVKKLPKISKIGRKSARFARFCQKVGEKLAEIVEPRGRRSERLLTDPIRHPVGHHKGALSRNHANPHKAKAVPIKFRASPVDNAVDKVVDKLSTTAQDAPLGHG